MGRAERARQQQRMEWVMRSCGLEMGRLQWNGVMPVQSDSGGVSTVNWGSRKEYGQGKDVRGHRAGSDNY